MLAPSKRGLHILVALSCLWLTACSSAGQLRELEQRRLVREEQGLIATKEFLEQHPRPHEAYDLSVFVSAHMLNDILRQVDGLTFPHPKRDDIHFRINSLRVDFRDGFPQLKLDAYAAHEAQDAEVQLAAAAYLYDVPAKGDASLGLKVGIIDIVPDVRWGPWEIGRWQFIRALLTLKADAYAEQMPAFEVPLSHLITVDTPPSKSQARFPLREGYVRGVVTAPGFFEEHEISIEKVLFLRDGIHIYARLLPVEAE